jgi:hypothetical protein
MKYGRQVISLKVVHICNPIASTIAKWQTFRLHEVDAKLEPVNMGP